MTRKRGPAVVYVVRWARTDIVKVGTSEHRRWLSFRDAKVLRLVEFDDVIAAYDFEQLLQRAVRRLGAGLAFDSGDQARPFLAGSGGGYCECYRITPRMLGVLLRACLAESTSAMQSRAEQSRELTKSRQDFLETYIALGDAHEKRPDSRRQATPC